MGDAAKDLNTEKRIVTNPTFERLYKNKSDYEAQQRYDELRTKPNKTPSEQAEQDYLYQSKRAK